MRMSVRNTTGRVHRRTGITLLEIICVVMVTGFALGLVTEVFVTHLQVNRRLTVSASRAATVNSLTQRLRADFLAARSFIVSKSTPDAADGETSVTISGSNGPTVYRFHRLDRRASEAEQDPAIDQIIARTDAAGDVHQWTLQAQTIDVGPSPAAPSRILVLKFRHNGRSSPGFNRRENLELSLITGAAP